MKNKFKDIWKHHFAPNIAEERAGATEYRGMALETQDPIKRGTFRNMAADEERHAENLEDMETTKSFDKTMSDFMVKMDEYMTTLGIKLKQKAVDTSFEGPEPVSLLAEQDLEGGKKREDIVTEQRANEPFRVLSDEAILDNLGKGKFEQTGKQLVAAAKDAKDAETKTEVKSVVENIKSVQLKRQAATLEAREKVIGKKSFKNVWGGFNK
jgi:rubrerythrin